MAQARGWHEHFLGSRRRVNVESVPRLPAWAVRWALDDPRGTPYLLLWRYPVSGELAAGLRVARYVPSRSVIAGHEYVERLPAGEEWVSTREGPEGPGSFRALRVMRPFLPRRRGRFLLLLCPSCWKPRRYLYAWEAWGNRVVGRVWQCRLCAGLRYQSEGIGPGYPRPETWDPYIFSSLERAAEALESWRGES